MVVGLGDEVEALGAVVAVGDYGGGGDLAGVVVHVGEVLFGGVGLEEIGGVVDEAFGG